MMHLFPFRVRLKYTGTERKVSLVGRLEIVRDIRALEDSDFRG